MRALLLASVLLLTACNGFFSRTTYEFVAPATPAGQACANHCLDALSACQARCQTDARMCETMNFTTRSIINRPMFDDECEPDLCLERCDTQHHFCHTNCGGQVIPHRS